MYWVHCVYASTVSGVAPALVCWAALQAQLFDVCGMEELVDAALDGYTVTIFAFGQTGSGKTYSICGPRWSMGQGQAQALHWVGLAAGLTAMEGTPARVGRA